MNINQNLLCFMNRSLETNSFCFPKIQCSQKSNFLIFLPDKRSFLLKASMPFFSLMVQPVVVEPSNLYKVPTFIPFINTNLHNSTFSRLLTFVSSSVTKDMRYFFKPGTCLASDNVPIMLSCILILVVPMPITLHKIISYQNNSTIKRIICGEPNTSKTHMIRTPRIQNSVAV